MKIARVVDGGTTDCENCSASLGVGIISRLVVGLLATTALLFSLGFYFGKVGFLAAIASALLTFAVTLALLALLCPVRIVGKQDSL